MFIAPEIVFKEKRPNIISDIYSIGTIMKLLLENTETSTDIFKKLVEDCLQTDSNKRINFDALALPPYFTSIHSVYKTFHSNFLFYNIRVFLHLHLHQGRKLNSKLLRFYLFRLLSNIKTHKKLIGKYLVL